MIYSAQNGLCAVIVPGAEERQVKWNIGSNGMPDLMP